MEVWRHFNAEPFIYLLQLILNNQITVTSNTRTLTEMIKALDTGSSPNLPVTGWEGMLGQGGADSLQQCAILAHSLMSQQFGVRSPEEESMGQAWDMPISPMSHQQGQQDPMSVISPVRGQQYHHHLHPAPHEQGYHHGQLSPHQEHNLSPVMTPVKMPQSPSHPISPEHHMMMASPHKKETFIDNNPGYFRGPPAPQWAPELAIQPSQPSYDELSHPPIASSLYGQDLRFNQNQYY